MSNTRAAISKKPAAGEIEYGCEACKISSYRPPFFYYFLDWCPKCGVERRFFTMASYAIKAKLAQFHKEAAAALPTKPTRKLWWAFWRKA